MGIVLGRRSSSAKTRPPSTGGCGRLRHRRAAHPGAPWKIWITWACATRCARTCPAAGCRWSTPPRYSASPGRPCCTRSRRGLAAVHVTVGCHEGLRIQAGHD